MSTNQEARQAAVRASTGTALDYNSDWSALFDQASIPAGEWDGRFLAWINAQLSTSYTEINGAMVAYAINQGYSDWNSMGTFTPGGGSGPTGNYLVLPGGVIWLVLPDAATWLIVP